MARWMAAVLGVVVVGLVVAGLPWRADAQADADRIAALEARVANLEQTLLLGRYDLSCAEGEITGELSVIDRGGYFEATLRWVPKTTPSNVNNPLLNRGVGAATFPIARS